MGLDHTNQSIENMYDEVPYPIISHSSSHPDRLATIAKLMGMDPAPLEQCRVLEVGCASGGNLIPMAQSFPESEFVGVDLSGQQIAQGQAALATLALPNVRLEHKDILDVGPDMGQFDYIIAHGIYSWVPPAVQNKLFEICRQNLRPNGVAYISYNIYPGWNMLGSLRQMMRYHTRQISDPMEKAAQARVLLDFLANSISTDTGSHGSFLYVYVNYIKEYFLPKDDSFLLHDELAEINSPVYFYEFAAQVAQYGLQYLGDVQFSTMLATNFPTEVATTLRRMVKNTVELEQYLDFLRNRMFRQSLLCRQDIQLKARLSPEQLTSFYVASSAVTESDRPDIESVSVERFTTLDGAVLTTDHPVTKAAMLYLNEIWPRAISFNELLTEANRRIYGPAKSQRAADAHLLGANLLKAYGYSENLVEFHVYAPQLVVEISDYPLVSPVARFQARQGYPVTNLRHERVTLDDVARDLLPYLDGSRDRASLLEVLVEKDMVEITRRDETQPVEDAAELRMALDQFLDKKLDQFAKAALLMG